MALSFSLQLSIKKNRCGLAALAGPYFYISHNSIFNMLQKSIQCLLCILLSTHLIFAQSGKPPVKYLTAQQVIDMAQTQDKPYLWVAVYIPKCAQAHQIFSDRVLFYNKHKDKLNMMMVSVLNSADNQNIFKNYSETFQYTSPFYAIDSSYQQQGIMQTHIQFIKDLRQKLGSGDGFAENIIIDNKGKIVYAEEGNLNPKVADKVLK
jgi:hypothetical protein